MDLQASFRLGKIFRNSTQVRRTACQKEGHNFLRGAATDKTNKGECLRTLELRGRGLSPDVTALGRTELLCGWSSELNETRGARPFPDSHSALVSRIPFSSCGICAEQDYDHIFGTQCAHG